MACFHPLEAYRTRAGEVRIGKQLPDSQPLSLPCGGCIGCRLDRAKSWALRCHLELQGHRSAVFTTLTYNEKNVPPTLRKRDLQLWLKRFRKALGPTRPIRFFASGEYGEKNQRPHYHAILYGIDVSASGEIEATWRKGYCKTVPVTPAAIAYVAGYTSKKVGFRLARGERVDPETGEVYEWEPPFVQMSRRPGIGARAKQWPESWREFGIHNGKRVPVPRYLHEAWREQATPESIAQLEYERQQRGMSREAVTREALQAAELYAIAKQRLQADRRKL